MSAHELASVRPPLGESPAELLAEPSEALTLLGLEGYVQSLLYAPVPAETLDALSESHLRQAIETLTVSVEGNDQEALRVFHSVLFRIYTAQFALPWERAAVNVHHPLFAGIRGRLETAWAVIEREHAEEAVLRLPSTPEGFRAFVGDFVRGHRSSELHPLFAFLRDQATFEQLRAFHYQETPLDIYFADILCLMMAGLPGAMRQELARNFWDEVGRGDLARTHRNLRLRMMRSFDISERIHVDAIETFVWEELALANLYFRTACDRRALLEGIGIMLATEMAVPGRLQCQLEGCRRIGLPEEALDYLVEHVEVDGDHAYGWMDQVVLPVLGHRGDIAQEVMVGIATRLELAGAVCDRMLRELSSLTA